MEKTKVAIVGATGMVGRTFLMVLEEFNIQEIDEYVLFSSARSAGKTIDFMGKEYTLQELTPSSFESGFTYALFSAGGAISKEYAPIAAATGCIVIDNSSCWRMDKDVPLIVPEVNPHAADIIPKNIIANPNCSTIQAMLPLKAIGEKFGLKRVIFSTYQAVSGAGVKGHDDLHLAAKAYANGEAFTPRKFVHPIFSNCIPHIDDFLESGYTKEEQKMIDETHKILGDDTIGVTATTVRVPVFNGHSESINIETLQPFTIESVKQCLSSFNESLMLVDDVANNKYPLASDADGSNKVFVGRVRRDFSVENGINLWCVADNIRKGAATNTVQIMQLLISKQK